MGPIEGNVSRPIIYFSASVAYLSQSSKIIISLSCFVFISPSQITNNHFLQRFVSRRPADDRCFFSTCISTKASLWCLPSCLFKRWGCCYDSPYHWMYIRPAEMESWECNSCSIYCIYMYIYIYMYAICIYRTNVALLGRKATEDERLQRLGMVQGIYWI